MSRNCSMNSIISALCFLQNYYSLYKAGFTLLTMDIPKICLQSNLLHFGKLIAVDFILQTWHQIKLLRLVYWQCLAFKVFLTQLRSLQILIRCVRTQFVSCTYFSGCLHYSVLRQISGNLLILCQSWSVPCCVANLLSSTDIWTFSSTLGKVLSWVHPHWTQIAIALPGLCLHEPVKVTYKINYFLYDTRFVGN